MHLTRAIRAQRRRHHRHLQGVSGMPTLAIQFTAGRYHATPWQTHVNEGTVEWPPSPWRLLRALMAVGFTKRGWAADLAAISQPARRLIEALASVLPQFRLPHGGMAHTRHYMPFAEGKAPQSTKVLDAFLRFHDDTPLLICWPTSLTASE